MSWRLKDNGFTSSKKGMDRRYEGRWRAMIHRCYNENHLAYKNYGAKGVYVCTEWHVYENYLKWCLENKVGDNHIDKDIKVPGNKCYGPDFCIVVSPFDNISHMAKNRDNSYLNGENHHLAIDVKSYENKPIIRVHFKDACKRKGWKFEDFTETVYDKLKTGHKRYIYKLKTIQK